MKWITLILLLLPFTVFSQEDTIYYIENQPLTWADFQAKPDLSNNNHAAMISSGFGVQSEFEVLGNNGTVHFDVSTYMLPAYSWVKPGKDNENVLAHEQLHFDITYYHSLLLEQKLNKLDYHPDIKQQVYEIVKQTYRDLDKMQTAYDDKTNGGLDLEAQHQWQQKVKKLIKRARP